MAVDRGTPSAPMLQIAASVDHQESSAGDGAQALAQVERWCLGRPTVVVDPTEGRRALRRVVRWSEESGPIHGHTSPQ